MLTSASEIAEVEAFLGREIEKVYEYLDSFCNTSGTIFAPGTRLLGAPVFSMINRFEGFNHETGVLTIIGRDKWERKLRRKKFQLERVGYKLPTSRLSKGYIWGNPKEVL